MKTIFAATFLMLGFVSEVLASEMCDQFINLTVGLDGPAVVKDGKLSVDPSSPKYKSMVAGESAKIMMNYFPSSESTSVSILTEVKVQRTGDDLTVSRQATTSDRLHASDVTGFETKYRTGDSGRCEMLYNVALYRQPDGILKRVVFDKKYCDQVRTILAKHGTEAAAKEKLRTCTDFLGDVRSAFNLRRAELAKQGIMMSDSEGPLATPTMGKDEQAGAGIVLGLMTLCSPHGWSEFTAQANTQFLRGTPLEPNKTSQ